MMYSQIYKPSNVEETRVIFCINFSLKGWVKEMFDMCNTPAKQTL